MHRRHRRCRTGHFWVLVAPGRHVLFEFTRNHSSDAVDDVLSGYQGYLVADAHTTEDMREWGFPVAPEESIAYTNAYWSSAAAPGRHGSVAPTAEVNFSAV